MRTGTLTALAVFAAALVYAVLRYVVFGPVATAHLPLYVTNKAVALTALAMLAVSTGSRSVEVRRRSGHLGMSLSVLHVLMTLPLLSPAYFEKLYLGPEGESGFSAATEVALGVGALAVVILLAIFVRSSLQRVLAFPWWWRVAGPGVLVLTGTHCLALGWRGWWTPAAWPGGLPPITLLGALLAMAGVALSLRPTRTDTAPLESPE